MATWIARLLTLIFIFNICVPQTLLAQSQPAAKKDIHAQINSKVQQSLDKPLEQAQSLEELESLYSHQLEKLLERYENLKIENDLNAHIQLNQIVNDIHALANWYPRLQEKISAKLKEKEQPISIQKPITSSSVSSTTSIPGEIQRREAEKDSLTEIQTAEIFLEQVKNNELDLEDLIEYIDPIDEGLNTTQSAVLSAYAAEVTLNTLWQFLLNPNSTDKEGWEYLLPRLQQRVLYRLYHLPEQHSNVARTNEIMARGTLRTLLYKIHEAYETLGLQDPVTTTHVTNETPVMIPTRAVYEQYVKNIHRQNRNSENKHKQIPLSYEDFCDTYAVPATPVSTENNSYRVKGEIQGGLPATGYTESTIKNEFAIQDERTFREIAQDILTEIKILKNSEGAQPGEMGFSLLNTMTEYAVRYAILANQTDIIPGLVQIFEEKPSTKLLNPKAYKETDFETDYSPILETLFGCMTETLKAFPVEHKTVEIIKSQLEEFASPVHATDTRVLAIGAAGLLNQSANWKTLYSFSNDQKPLNLHFTLSAQTRQKLARYAVTLYKHAGNEMKGYGLDSQQMKELQDQLASFIEALMPLTAPEVVWNPQHNRYEPDTSRTKTVQTLLPPSIFSRSDKLFMPVYLYDNEGGVVHVRIHNPINQLKKNGEDVMFTLGIAKEIVMWTALPTQGFMMGYRALQMAGHAIAMVPAAYRAAKVVQKGNKVRRFTTKIRQGSRYGSIQHNLAKRGTSLTATRSEDVIKKTVQDGKKVKEKMSEPVTRATGRYGSPYSKATQVGDGTLNAKEYATAGFWKRAWNSLWGKKPEVISYTLQQNRNGQIVEATIEATGSLKKGLGSPLQNAKFLREAQRNGINLDPLWRESASGAMRLTGNGKVNNFTTWLNNAKNRQEAFYQYQRSQGRVQTVQSTLQKDLATQAPGQTKHYTFYLKDGNSWREVSGREFTALWNNLKANKSFGKTITEEEAAFEMFGLNPKAATRGRLQKVYHQKVRDLHPDRTGGNKVLEEEFKKITEAYETAQKAIARGIRPNSMRAAKQTVEPVVAIRMKKTPFSGADPLADGKAFATGTQTTSLPHSVAHMLEKTNQYSLLPLGMRIWNNPWSKQLIGNWLFFGTFDIIDRGMYKVQDKVVSSAQKKQMQEELNKYSIFKELEDEAKKKKEEEENPILAKQKKNNPKPEEEEDKTLDVVSQVQDASRHVGAHEGASMTVLPLTGMAVFGYNFIKKHPLTLDLYKQATQTTIHQAIAKGNEIREEKTLSKHIESLTQHASSYLNFKKDFDKTLEELEKQMLPQYGEEITQQYIENLRTQMESWGYQDLYKPAKAYIDALQRVADSPLDLEQRAKYLETVIQNQGVAFTNVQIPFDNKYMLANMQTEALAPIHEKEGIITQAGGEYLEKLATLAADTQQKMYAIFGNINEQVTEEKINKAQKVIAQTKKAVEHLYNNLPWTEELLEIEIINTINQCPDFQLLDQATANSYIDKFQAVLYQEDLSITEKRKACKTLQENFIADYTKAVEAYEKTLKEMLNNQANIKWEQQADDVIPDDASYDEFYDEKTDLLDETAPDPHQTIGQAPY